MGFDCIIVAATANRSDRLYLFDRADDERVELLTRQGGRLLKGPLTKADIRKRELVDCLIVPDAQTRDRLKRFMGTH